MTPRDELAKLIRVGRDTPNFCGLCDRFPKSHVRCQCLELADSIIAAGWVRAEPAADAMAAAREIAHTVASCRGGYHARQCNDLTIEIAAAITQARAASPDMVAVREALENILAFDDEVGIHDEVYDDQGTPAGVQSDAFAETLKQARAALSAAPDKETMLTELFNAARHVVHRYGEGRLSPVDVNGLVDALEQLSPSPAIKSTVRGT